jgi:hypothetical protein
MTESDANTEAMTPRVNAPGVGRARTAAAQALGARPLLDPFALAVMTLATFMVVFALMMARLNHEVGSAPRSSGTATPLVGGSTASRVMTRASGAGAAGGGAARVAPSEGPSAVTPPIGSCSYDAGAGDDRATC